MSACAAAVPVDTLPPSHDARPNTVRATFSADYPRQATQFPLSSPSHPTPYAPSHRLILATFGQLRPWQSGACTKHATDHVPGSASMTALSWKHHLPPEGLQTGINLFVSYLSSRLKPSCVPRGCLAVRGQQVGCSAAMQVLCERTNESPNGSCPSGSRKGPTQERALGQGPACKEDSPPTCWQYA